MAKFLIPMCFLLLAIIHTGSSLKCYSCDSKNKKECLDPFNGANIPLNECPKPQNADHSSSSCVKVTTTEDSGNMKVRRYCYVHPANQKPCDHLQTPNIKECMGCETDGCNNSDMISTSSYVLLATSIMAVVNYIVRS